MIFFFFKTSEKAHSLRPGEGESRLEIALCRKQHRFLPGVKLLLPFVKWRMDSTLYKIQLNFVAGVKTNFSQSFQIMQYIIDVKIGLELPFGAYAHLEGDIKCMYLLQLCKPATSKLVKTRSWTALISYTWDLWTK
jgi:hypothetical protein